MLSKNRTHTNIVPQLINVQFLYKVYVLKNISTKLKLRLSNYLIVITKPQI